jgi:hypothetical protein
MKKLLKKDKERIERMMAEQVLDQDASNFSQVQIFLMKRKARVQKTFMIYFEESLMGTD